MELPSLIPTMTLNVGIIPCKTTKNINKKDKESFWEKESESNSPSVDELLKGLNMKNETVGDTRPLYVLYPDWYSPISDYSDYSDYDEY